MSLRNNIQGIQAMSSAAGVTAYKADIMSVASTLGINIEIAQSSTERRKIADTLIEKASKSLTTTEVTPLTSQSQNVALAVDNSELEPIALQIKEVGSIELAQASERILEDYALNILSKRQANQKLLAILRQAQRQTTQDLATALDDIDQKLADELDTLITRRRAMHSQAAQRSDAQLQNFAQRLGVTL